MCLWVVDKDEVFTVLVGSTTTRDLSLVEASEDDEDMVASVPVPSPYMPLCPSVSDVSPPETQWPAASPPSWPISPSPALEDAVTIYTIEIGRARVGKECRL